ncbi:lytic murein transglycosylase [Burkholderiaceae bacterium FT117]|uniref:lytic murein transglycosylase n=1 Tax=Zeimonas sediminis TaxID=2944268 RepID=UPI0023430FCB|nr:lytic murein transglycosylase [Zeimonas sediminis]MCM5571111.1 lytic murein transglycosylase [Zeimonas sediminis]
MPSRTALRPVLGAALLATALLSAPAGAQPGKSPAAAGSAGQPRAASASGADAGAGVRPADFAACLARLRPEAIEKGISGATYDRHTASLVPDMAVIGFLDAQPEFVTPIWDYLAALVDDERVADGRAMLERWREVLAKVEAEYGVDPATVVAVWGVESDFGRRFGKRPLLESLSTLSCYGRRQSFFRGEFFTTLRIVQEGHVAPEKLAGSWAGAFGHTQFMPSTFMRLAVDFDGDGRRDLVDSVPDALASTANFLKRAGWRSDIPWGFEVKLPAGFDASAAGRRNKQPASVWASRGVKRVDGGALSADTPSAILLPAGPQGPAFLVTRNFDALYSYNAAESYALAIAHLSDRLRGGGAFAAPWPTDDPGLSRAERRELQRLLIARGHDIGEADGMIGSRTREALKAELAMLGIESDGRAGQKALAALRKAAERR